MALTEAVGPIETPAFQVKNGVTAMPEFVAGFIFAIAGNNDLEDIETCMTDVGRLNSDIKKIWDDVTHLKIVHLMWDLPDFIDSLRSALAPCTQIGDDLKEIAGMAKIFTKPEELGENMTYNWLHSKTDIKNYMSSAESSWATDDYFTSGKNFGDMTHTLLQDVPSPTAVVASKGPAFKVNHILAGLIEGMIGQNDLEEIEACYGGGKEMTHELKKAINNFKSGGWNSITQGALDVVKIGLQIPQELHTCKNMQADLDTIEAWGKQFTDISKLAAKVTKHYLLNKKQVTADIDGLKKDWAAEEFFETGQDLATIVNLLIEGAKRDEMYEMVETSDSPSPAFMVNHIVAGFLQAMTGTNNLTEIEACFKGGKEMEHEIVKAIGSFKKGGWNSITQGALDIVELGLQIPQELHTCKNMDEDLTAIKNWALQFKDTKKLMAKVTRHYVMNKKLVTADIDGLEKDFAAMEFFETGQDLAGLINLLLEGKK